MFLKREARRDRASHDLIVAKKESAEASVSADTPEDKVDEEM